MGDRSTGEESRFDLVIDDVRKTFPANGVTALDGVSARFRAGAVHAVVGENGAGKSTLMHVVAGFHAADGGTVTVAGRSLPLGSTRRAIEAGVFMVYQYPQIVGDFPLWEHLLLSAPGPLVSPASARRRASDLMRRYGLSIDVGTPMGRLNPSQIYMVGMAVAAESEPRVLILDEPTVGCTDREIDSIFELMRKLSRRPAVVILITHKLRDVFRVAETALVMRKGRAVSHLPVADTTAAQISQLILGEAARREAPTDRERGSRPPGEQRLGLHSVELVRQGRAVLQDVNLSVGSGEIVGLIGIRENGLDWIEEVVSGMSVPTGGTVTLLGRDITGAGPRDLRRAGLAYVPTDRLSRGASLGSSVTDNLIVADRRGMHRYGVLHREEISAFAASRKAELDIQGNLSEPLFRLSGGNIQKVILSRELSGDPAVLVFAEPSWGLDLATRSSVFRRLRRLRDGGTAVLLITTDLDEVLELADRVAVVRDGTVVAVLEDADRSRVGDLMLGVANR